MQMTCKTMQVTKSQFNRVNYYSKAEKNLTYPTSFILTKAVSDYGLSCLALSFPLSKKSNNFFFFACCIVCDQIQETKNGHVSFASPFECQVKQLSLNVGYPTYLLASLTPGMRDQARSGHEP